MASWERWEDSEVARWNRWKSSEVPRWEVPGFIQGWGGDTWVSPRFCLFVSDAHQRNEGVGWVQDFLVWLKEWKDSP